MTVYTDLTWKGFKNYPIFTTHTIKYIQGTMDINALIHQFAHLGDPKDFILKFIIVKLLSWSQENLKKGPELTLHARSKNFRHCRLPLQCRQCQKFLDRACIIQIPPTTTTFQTNCIVSMSQNSDCYDTPICEGTPVHQDTTDSINLQICSRRTA